MEIINSEWRSFHAAQEEERQPTTAHEAKEEKQATNKIAEQLPPHFVTHMLTVLATLPSEEPNKLFFMDALQAKDGDENPLLFKDAREKLKPHIGLERHSTYQLTTPHSSATQQLTYSLTKLTMMNYWDTMNLLIPWPLQYEQKQPYPRWKPCNHT